VRGFLPDQPEAFLRGSSLGVADLNFQEFPSEWCQNGNNESTIAIGPSGRLFTKACGETLSQVAPNDPPAPRITL